MSTMNCNTCGEDTCDAYDPLAKGPLSCWKIPRESLNVAAQAQYDKLRGNYDHDLRIFKEHQTALEEAQARIKELADMLEIVLRHFTKSPSTLADTTVRGAAHKILLSTFPTEALDKVVREAKAQTLEEAATYLEGDGAAFDDVQTLRERAEAIRRIEP